MFEHVGPANYRGYFETVSRLLEPDGLFLLHTIGGRYSETTSDPWMARYVFPGSVLPSSAQIARAIEGLFVLEDWHNFGADYDRTLMAWYHNIDAAWPTLEPRPSDRRRRLWTYYLLTCAGTFRARRNQLWQIVLSPRGVRGGYRRI
jgi:cyclopropane-fatty-acyl-phospholipid synthase